MNDYEEACSLTRWYNSQSVGGESQHKLHHLMLIVTCYASTKAKTTIGNCFQNRKQILLNYDIFYVCYLKKMLETYKS